MTSKLAIPTAELLGAVRTARDEPGRVVQVRAVRTTAL
jgi:hypothetical protein